MLFLYAHGSRKFLMDPAGLVLPVLLSLVLAAVVFLVGRVLLRSSARAGAVASAFIVLFFVYGDALDGIRRLWPAAPPESLLVLWALLLGMVYWLVRRSRRRFDSLTLVLNTVAVVVVAINVVGSMPGLLRYGRRVALPVRAPSLVPVDRPDIYYIILDGYGRSDILRERYAFDNSSLLDSLRRLGFHVADRSQANYCQTYLSLASALNMSYLDELAQTVGTDSDDRTELERMLAGNAVSALLHEQGYRTIAFASGYGGTDLVQADLRLGPPGALSEFQRVWLSMTALAPVVFEQLDAASHRARTLYAFEHLPDVAAAQGPAFVYAHILAAHTPFVFGEQGERVSPVYFRGMPENAAPWMVKQESERYRAALRRQLTYLDRRVLEVVGLILARSRTPPVVVLQSDHGPGLELALDSPDSVSLAERMSNLLALHLPGANGQGLSDSMTPVNIFRLVFRRLFGTADTLLPDRSYFSTWDRPYAFTDICDLMTTQKPGAESVSVVAFPVGLSSIPAEYYADVAHRRFPGSSLAIVYQTPVSALLSADEAANEYRKGVARGELTDLGRPTGSFRDTGQYHVTGLFFRADAATR